MVNQLFARWFAALLMEVAISNVGNEKRDQNGGFRSDMPWDVQISVVEKEAFFTFFSAVSLPHYPVLRFSLAVHSDPEAGMRISSNARVMSLTDLKVS
jgi:hypothetical protein